MPHVAANSGPDYTPADDAALSAGLDRIYQRGRPSARDEELAEEDRRAAEYMASLPGPADVEP